MAGNYSPQSFYFSNTRLMLQDLVLPYRYTDSNLMFSLNTCLRELTRLRPDVYLDLKYQNRLSTGDIRSGNENIAFALDPATGNAPVAGSTVDTLMPIPEPYQQAFIWGAAGIAQLFDVNDTQDQRGQAFMQKFSSHLLTLTAA